MNDKIKDLLSTAYKTDSIEKNKWRIENREQLREQRKKELKELMKIDFKGYTPKQYAVLIMRQDLKYSIREISERLGYSQSGVRYILMMKK